MTTTTTPATPTPAATLAAPVIPTPAKASPNPDQTGWINRSREAATAILAAVDAASSLKTNYVANNYADPATGLQPSSFNANNAGKTPQHASDYANAIAAMENLLNEKISGDPNAPTIRTALARFAKSK